MLYGNIGLVKAMYIERLSINLFLVFDITRAGRLLFSPLFRYSYPHRLWAQYAFTAQISTPSQETLKVFSAFHNLQTMTDKLSIKIERKKIKSELGVVFDSKVCSPHQRNHGNVSTNLIHH